MVPRLGLIGIGGFGKFYLEHLIPYAEKGEIQIAAAVARQPGKYSDTVAELRRLGGRIFPDSQAMYRELGGSLDVIGIPTGIDTHCLYTCEALEYGCRVLVEKPAAGTVAEVGRMMAAERLSGQWVMVGFQHLSSPEIQDLKRRLVNREFGEVKTITAMGRWPRADAYYRRNDWAARLKTASGVIVNDSPANNAFAHYLNLALFLAGQEFSRSAQPLQVEGLLFRARAIETFDTCEINVATDNGVEVRTLFTHACAEDCHPRLKICCGNNTVLWQNSGFYQVLDAAGEVLETSAAYHAHENMFRAFLAKLHDPAVFSCTLEIALAHTKTIEMLHRNMVVKNIPSEEITVDPENGQHVIRWVASAFDLAFHDNCGLRKTREP